MVSQTRLIQISLSLFSVCWQGIPDTTSNNDHWAHRVRHSVTLIAQQVRVPFQVSTTLTARELLVVHLLSLSRTSLTSLDSWKVIARYNQASIANEYDIQLDNPA